MTTDNHHFGVIQAVDMPNHVLSVFENLLRCAVHHPVLVFFTQWVAICIKSGCVDIDTILGRPKNKMLWHCTYPLYIVHIWY